MPFHKGGSLSQTMHIEEGETVCEKRHPRRENIILKLLGMHLGRELTWVIT